MHRSTRARRGAEALAASVLWLLAAMPAWANSPNPAELSPEELASYERGVRLWFGAICGCSALLVIATSVGAFLLIRWLVRRNRAAAAARADENQPGVSAEAAIAPPWATDPVDTTPPVATDGMPPEVAYSEPPESL